MDDPRLTRRWLLAGAGLAAVATTTACATAAPASPAQPSASASPSPVPPSPTTAPTTPAPAPSPAQTDLATLRRKIASLLVVGFRGQQLGTNDWILKAISAQGLGGVILFDVDQLTGTRRNISSPAQVTSLIRTLRQASPGRLIVSIDQEGGQIARLNSRDGFPATASEASIGATNSASTTRSWAQGIAGNLAAIGVGVNFAPVVDLNVNPQDPAIGALSRSFSANPDIVVSNATVEIQAHRAAGVRTALKHFPGLGSATGNTDFGVVDVSTTWRRTELEPYTRLIAARLVDAVLVTHVLNRQLDPALPASLSPAVVRDLLRGQLGWQGPVVSDDMQAAAITKQYGSADAVTKAVLAGVDLLVFANQQVYDPDVVEKTIDTVVGLVQGGQLTEAQIDQSVARVDTLRPAA